jgi:hypothetical protein
MKYVVEFLAYARIFLSPLLFFSIIGGLFYWYDTASTGFIIASVFVVIGILSGIMLCAYARRKGGAVNFISRLHATPELDKKKD